MHRWIVTSVATAILASTSGANAAALPYLSEQLGHRNYDAPFRALFPDQANLRPWLARYLANHDGVEMPGHMVEANGQRYEIYTVCQPHNCAGNFLYVLFKPGGNAAWALLTGDGGKNSLFGAPNYQQESVLEREAEAK